MAIRQVISCDVCGRDQGAVNHWWCVWVEKGVFHSCSVVKAPKRKVHHACGNEHETVLHHRWLTTGRLEMEMHPEPKEKPVGLTEEDLGVKKDAVES